MVKPLDISKEPNHPYWKILDSDKEIRDGTNDFSLGEFDSEQMKDHQHTHCSDCDKPYNTTHHFMGDGIMCKECTDKRFPNLKEQIKSTKERLKNEPR